MKSKQLKTAVIVTIAYYLLVIFLYSSYRGSKAHLDARQAESFFNQLADNKYDRVRDDILISEWTAIKIASKIFSEKYGYRRTFLFKPFDTYLFNNNWFVYGPVSKSKHDYGPMIIINQYTGETRFKP